MNDATIQPGADDAGPQGSRLLLTAHGGLTPVMTSTTTVERDGRQLLLTTFIDVSELEEAREAVEKARDELEEKVQERTRELEQANATLREMDSAKNLFLSSASHELRTPLTSIMGFLKLMERSFVKHFAPLLREDHGLAERVRIFQENLTVVRNEATRLGRLVDDLLDLNRIDSGRMQWRDAPTAPAPLLREALDAVSGLLEDKPDVALRLEVEEDLPELLVDPDRIHQVLNNLLNNAVKFTDRGSITLKARRISGGLEVTVLDTGSGIDAADHERIFEIFYQSQAEDIRSTNPFGTGLGLAICRKIVRHYGGDIRVESTPGRGSAFIFTLLAASSRPAA